MAEWCEKCALAGYEGEGCMIQLRALAFGTHAPEYPAEWNYTNAGTPQCTAFRAEPEAEPRCDKTPDMFEQLEEQPSQPGKPRNDT